ncbi:LacI family DNA-binding transcriptional regulator [Microbacterium sp. BWT-B31]|uniref:LacI family DNA-binding transcriptional regulator n=1 Tax=Microbacterium sp. BWT-B31 TaxID=3232072 RepID=UPI0035289378
MTLNEVSERAGVSRATASLVLRGSPKISVATRERVQKAMADLGYVYNRQAANMRQSRSMAIGVVETDIRNPYFAELTMAIEEAVHQAGFTLFIGYSRDRLERQRELLDAMVQRQVDGILLLPAIGTTMENVGPVTGQFGPPLIQISRYFTDQFDYVGPDNLVASDELAEHVSSLGCSTAILVGGPDGSSARRERLEGLRRSFEATPTAFDADDSVTTLNNADDGARGLAEALDRGALPDAIIAYSDAVAQGVYAELRRRNLTPGTDVAVASFDDIPLAALQMPPLTSVATSADEVGRAASRLLLARLEGAGAEHQSLLIEPTLKVRASTALWRPRISGGQS